MKVRYSYSMRSRQCIDHIVESPTHRLFEPYPCWSFIGYQSWKQADCPDATRTICQCLELVEPNLDKHVMATYLQISSEPAPAVKAFGGELKAGSQACIGTDAWGICSGYLAVDVKGLGIRIKNLGDQNVWESPLGPRAPGIGIGRSLLYGRGRIQPQDRANT